MIEIWREMHSWSEAVAAALLFYLRVSLPFASLVNDYLPSVRRKILKQHKRDKAHNGSLLSVT